MSEEKQYGADLVVDSLMLMMLIMSLGLRCKNRQGFDTLENKGPELIVAVIEQNAALWLKSVGRITETRCSIGNIWSECAPIWLLVLVTATDGRRSCSLLIGQVSIAIF